MGEAPHPQCITLNGVKAAEEATTGLYHVLEIIYEDAVFGVVCANNAQ